ncbi:hypothetical protein XENTR_v10022586 [Xenopus tropicalis]|uniref:Uncharacterized protein LOC100498635 n=1 Tax=Xenopus tropicalis TaxID=8364 RepID=A0A8J0R2Q6_XENTR|nr:uncharacterized protein LOC100498635 [Xenopus tropicalis]XP_031747811.1 uncharacterized protein LOC100498635 [Xenopus tropicalis]KAE8588507.1 hypothetical protein XENTR_v10022586 [Xenopus tropicalis]|eukprot:XP_004917639.1 PREDICTED: uncharacterized protein LOC100498635 [Xenopus tropicalis]
MVPLYRSLMLFILLKCMFPEMSPLIRWASGSSIPMDSVCGPTKVIRAEEGAHVFLPVPESRTGPFTWRFDTGNFFLKFARTEAGGKVQEIDDRFMEGVSSAGFKGRVSSTEDGSLIIANVSTNDPQIYFEFADGRGCVQEYRLLIYKSLKAEDILIRCNANVTGMEPRNITLTCAVAQPHVNVSWDVTNRTGAEAEGHTLHIYNVDTNDTYSCTAQDSISRASRTINPWDLCHQGFGKESLPTVPAPNQNVNEEKQTCHIHIHSIPQPDPETD